MIGHAGWVLLAALLLTPPNDDILGKDFRDWTLEEAIWVLNESPWAKRETFTRVVEGIGSGVRGEKEVLSTYFVRFLSARPVRQAYVRIQQIRSGYSEMSESEKRGFDRETMGILDLDVSRWVVVAVAFRSNEQDQELRFTQHFEVQSVDTLRQATSLSTRRFPKLEPAAYFPPAEKSVGARFVFPREIDGTPVISPQDEEVSFELEVPVGGSDLRSTFDVGQMMVDGQLVY